MRSLPLLLLSLCSLARGSDEFYDGGGGSGGRGGDYGSGDYGSSGGGMGEDNIYQDYAKRQQDKAVGGPGAGGGFGVVGLCLSACAGFAVSHLYQGRVKRRLKRQHQAEQKKVYTKYYEDIALYEEAVVRYKMEAEQLRRDYKAEADAREYDEFRAPDIDNDNQISRAEFNMYVQTYLANYPGMSEAEYPRFEDFDHDRDGYVSFQEYSEQMALQVQQAAMKESKAGQRALTDLYQETQKRGNNNFNDLYQQTYR